MTVPARLSNQHTTSYFNWKCGIQCLKVVLVIIFWLYLYFLGISIEELIEEKRAELSASSGLTPVTLESFVKWKRRKLAEKAEAEKKEADKKKDRAKAGMTHGLSGRDMFSFNPTMAGGDDDDEDGGEAFDMKLREQDEGEDDGVQVHHPTNTTGFIFVNATFCQDHSHALASATRRHETFTRTEQNFVCARSFDAIF